MAPAAANIQERRGFVATAAETASDSSLLRALFKSPTTSFMVSYRCSGSFTRHLSRTCWKSETISVETSAPKEGSEGADSFMIA